MPDPNGSIRRLTNILAGAAVVVLGAAAIHGFGLSAETQVQGAKIQALERERDALQAGISDLREVMDLRLQRVEREVATANAKLDTLHTLLNGPNGRKGHAR